MANEPQEQQVGNKHPAPLFADYDGELSIRPHKVHSRPADRNGPTRPAERKAEWGGVSHWSRHSARLACRPGCRKEHEWRPPDTALSSFRSPTAKAGLSWRVGLLSFFQGCKQGREQGQMERHELHGMDSPLFNVGKASQGVTAHILSSHPLYFKPYTSVTLF